MEEVDPDMLDTAMTVCRRNLLELDDIIDNPYKALVKPSEWLVLSRGNKRRFGKGKINKKSTS